MRHDNWLNTFDVYREPDSWDNGGISRLGIVISAVFALFLTYNIYTYQSQAIAFQNEPLSAKGRITRSEVRDCAFFAECNWSRMTQFDDAYNHHLTVSFQTQTGARIEAETVDPIAFRRGPGSREVGDTIQLTYLESKPEQFLIGKPRHRVIGWNFYSVLSAIMLACCLWNIFIRSRNFDQ